MMVQIPDYGKNEFIDDEYGRPLHKVTGFNLAKAMRERRYHPARKHHSLAQVRQQAKHMVKNI